MKATPKDSLQNFNYFFLEAIRQQEMGNFTAAFDLLRHAQDLNPQSSEVCYHLATFFAEIKNDSLAREYLEKATNLAPKIMH